MYIILSHLRKVYYYLKQSLFLIIVNYRGVFMNVYLDNASTTFPKPKIVADSIYDYLINVGGNANRANYSNSLESNRKLLLARETIAEFFKFPKFLKILDYKYEISK